MSTSGFPLYTTLHNMEAKFKDPHIRLETITLDADELKRFGMRPSKGETTRRVWRVSAGERGGPLLHTYAERPAGALDLMATILHNECSNCAHKLKEHTGYKCLFASTYFRCNGFQDVDYRELEVLKS